jgi:hypothetical protein
VDVLVLAAAHGRCMLWWRTVDGVGEENKKVSKNAVGRLDANSRRLMQ